MSFLDVVDSLNGAAASQLLAILPDQRNIGTSVKVRRRLRSRRNPVSSVPTRFARPKISG
jgi:hypothetical protein